MKTNYNLLLNTLSFIEKTKAPTNIYRQKLGVQRIYGQHQASRSNNDNWTLTGTDKLHNLQRFHNEAILEIILDIPQDKIHSHTFEIKDSVLGQFLYDNDLLQDESSVVQTSQKQGDQYEINNYHIQESFGELKFHHTSKAIIDPTTYKNSFPLDKEGFGSTTLLLNVRIPPYFYKDIDCSIAADSSNKALNYAIINTVNSGRRSRSAYDIITPAYTFFASVHIITFLKIIKNRTGISFSDELFNYLNFTYHVALSSSGPITKSFNDIIFDADIEPGASELNTLIFPSITGEDEQNVLNPFDVFTYDDIMYFDKSGTHIIKTPDVVEPQLTLEDISAKIKIATRANLHKLETKLILPPIGMVPQKEILKKMHIDNYQSRIDSIKSHWEKTILVYDRIYKGKPINRNMFALLFIKKYFIPGSNSPYELLSSVSDKLNPILSFFEDNYMKFDEFFGENYLSKYIDGLSKYELDLYYWRHDRLENEKNVFFRAGSVRHRTASNTDLLWPNGNFSTFNKSSSLRENLLIINDSLTKTSWKNKTRTFIKGKSRIYSFSSIGVLDVQDKFQLMVIKRLLKDYSGVVFYSDFESSITKTTATVTSKVKEQVSYYNKNSFDNTRQVKSMKSMIEHIDMNSKLFVEYVVTKRTYNFQGKVYSEDQFNFLRWSKLIQEYQKKELILVNKNTLKKMKDYYGDELLMLEDQLEEPQFLSNFSTLNQEYLFLDFNKCYRNIVNKTVDFLVKELLDPFQNRTVQPKDQVINLESIIYLILNSFESDKGILFNTLIRMASSKRKGQRFGTRHGVIHKITSSIFEIPSIGTIDYILYNILDVDPNIPKIEKAFQELKSFMESGYQVGYESRNFMLRDFHEDYKLLLERSNYLNIDNTESLLKEKVLIDHYMHIWDTRVRYIDNFVS